MMCLHAAGRVPPLMMLDLILHRTHLLAIFEWLQLTISLDTDWTFHLVILVLELVCTLAFGVMFALGIQHLVYLYSYILSVAMLSVSYHYNRHYTTYLYLSVRGGDSVLSPGTRLTALLSVFTLQICAAYCINGMRRQYRVVSPALVVAPGEVTTYVSTLAPILVAHVQTFIPGVEISSLGVLCGMSPLLLETSMVLFSQLGPIINMFKAWWFTAKTQVKTYGLPAFVETQWTRLHIPTVLRIYWCCTVCVELMYATSLQVSQRSSMWLTLDDWWEVGRHLCIRGCSTVIAVLGMSSYVSYISHYIGMTMAYVIGSVDDDESQNIGSVTAVLFFILALQTGITGLEDSKKLLRLYRNCFLLLTAVLHFFHSMTTPLLMSLSASKNPDIMKHLRPLVVCLVLLVAPVFIVWHLWSVNAFSTWLLSVSAFSIEVILKVLVTLAVYLLFMVDAYWSATYWEGLDDYVYYIKSFGNSVEFVIGVFLLFNGAWTLVFESGGTIRATMMCIHAYFNIYVQAKSGWKIFMQRRTAVSKINSLPNATQLELNKLNDICAICYQELTVAKVTRCKHYFHALCLRKWLYVQDKCPLCHKLIYEVKNEDDEQEDDIGHHQGGAQNHVHVE